MFGVDRPAKQQDRRHEREEMVETQLVARGIRDPRVLSVMRMVPREDFLPPGLDSQAYCDRALAVDYGQTISQPYIVALMSESLEVSPLHSVLEIGTGTGYQTVVLAMLARHVYTVERIAELSDTASLRFRGTGLTNASFSTHDGSLGWPEHAPFDRIMVTAAAPLVPAALLEQLAEGGRLVIPVGDEASQRLILVTRAAGRCDEKPLIPVRFVPLLGASGFRE